MPSSRAGRQLRQWRVFAAAPERRGEHLPLTQLAPRAGAMGITRGFPVTRPGPPCPRSLLCCPYWAAVCRDCARGERSQFLRRDRQGPGDESRAGSARRSAHARSSARPELSLDWRDKSARELKLDTRGLSIATVEILDATGKASPATFSLGAVDKILGAPLIVKFDEQAPKVRVSYATNPEASGLQWLSEAQTAGKQHPFLFSQSQAIHARSWVPLQDTPAVRFTYRADVHVPEGTARRDEREQ